MARKIQVELVGDSSSLERAFGRASGAGGKFGGTLKSLGRVAAVGVGAAFAGLAATLKVGFDELAEGQKVSAQTGAVLKSTGASANVTAKEVEKLATSLSLMSGRDDEAIQAGENMLLTFTKVRNEVGKGNDVFNQATTTLLDMSQALGTDMNKSAIQLGKALNDPIKGITALTRVGVTFDEGQKKQIKSMVEAGNVMGAQKLILAELNKEFGGSAKAFGETMPGQLAKLKNSFEEVAGGIAETLLPYLMQLLDWTNRNMPTIQRVIQTTLDAVVATIQFLAPIIAALIGWFQKLAAATQEHWPRIQAVIQSVINWFRTNIVPTVSAVVNALIALWERFGSQIVAVVGPAFKIIVTIIDTVMRSIKAVIEAIMAVIRGDWGKAWEALKSLVSIQINGIKTIITTALTRLVPAVLGLALSIGKAIVGGIAQGLANLVSAGLSQLQKLPGILSGIAGQVPGMAAAIGRAIVSGILSGMSGLFGSVKDKIIGGVKGAIDGAMGVFGHSPQEVIGFALVEGILRGWESRAGKLKESMQTKITEAVDAARSAIGNAQAGFASAFGDLMSNALSAFDAKASLIETRTEKLLRLMDEATRKADLKGAISQAQKDLQAAQAAFATVTPQAGEDEAAFNQRIGEALAKTMAAQKTLDDALAAQQRFRLDQQAIKERKALDDRLALRRRHFEEDLLGLQNYANNHALSAEQLNQRLIAIFGKYRVPFKKAAIELGSALAEGLREAAIEVGNQAAAVRNEIMKHLSNIQVRINVDVVVPDKPDRRQHGGPVRAKRAYIVGEAGPELFIPKSSGRIMANGSGSMAAVAGGGGVNINVNVYGPAVGTGRDFEDAVRRAFYDVSRRNPKLAI